MPGAKLTKVQAAEVRFDGADLSGADLAEASLMSSYFVQANLEKASLKKAQLKFANLRQANLARADLSEALMRLCEMPEAILAEALLIKTDLSSADLRGVDLTAANLTEANVCGADLRGAILGRSVLKGIRFDASTLWDGVVGLETAVGAPAELYALLGLRPPAPPPAPKPKPEPKRATKSMPIPVALGPPKAIVVAETAPPPVVNKPKPLPKVPQDAIWEELLCGEPDRVKKAADQLDKKARAHYAAKLAPLVLGKDPSAALSASEALSYLPEPSVAGDLLKALITASPETCSSVAWIFRTWAVPVLEGPILKLLGRVDASRQANLIWILEVVGTQASVESLEALASDRNPDVQAAAAMALEGVRKRLG